MPNHITNRITSTPDVTTKVATALRGEGEQAVDFNRLSPMPAILDSGDASPCIEDMAKNVLDGGSCAPRYQHEKRVRDYPDADFERLITYLRALRETGHASWYSWCCEFWGTKWNAYDVAIELGRIQFDTAWSCPEPIVRKLAGVVPLCWTWEYADEDIGNNCGTWTCADGVLTWAEPIDAVRFACDVKDQDYEEYIHG